MADNKPWYRAVLGAELCASDPDGGAKRVPVEEALAKVEVVALYFPPLHGDDLADQLATVYDKVNAEGDRLRLRVVEVQLPRPPVSPRGPPPRCKLPHLQVPWFAVPPDDYDRLRRVCGRFRVRADLQYCCLVLLDGPSGRLLTRAGRERVLADPHGLSFPWPARPLHHVLHGARLLHQGKETALEDIKVSPDLVIGFYFSAHWCPPCKAFTPQLVSTYNQVRQRGENFEVIFVSSDRSEESFEQYARRMPWPAVSWRDVAARQELASLLAVHSIPSLVLVHLRMHAQDQDRACTLITDDGRTRIYEDPDGREFPWRPEPVSIYNDRLLMRLHDHPAIILFVESNQGEVDWAKGVLNHVAEVYSTRYPSTPATLQEPRLQFYVAPDGDASDSLREQLVLEDAVPLLVAVDMWWGAVSVLEDEEDEDSISISATSAVAFMEAFLEGELPFAPIGVLLPVPKPLPIMLLQQDAQPVEA